MQYKVLGSLFFSLMTIAFSLSAHGTSEAATAPSGASLYATYCASCHGQLASSTKKGATTARITNAISTVSAMRSLSKLTTTQIQAIATALATTTSTSGSGTTTGSTGSTSTGTSTTTWTPPPAQMPPSHPGTIVPAQNGASYVVFAWNDLGMHCANSSYDTAVILPPYNNVWAQVLQRGNPPKVVTAGLTVEYRVVNNTLSSNKGTYWQFWQYCAKLFGVNLATDTGLNLVDPTIHNGLAGKMVAKGDHFQVNGVPITPIDDSGVWNPFQVIKVTVKDKSGNIVAQTRTTIPISDEINCAKCHNGNKNPMLDVLLKHDKNVGTNLVNQMPVLCASCHGSPALGTSGRGTSGKYLSEAIHGYHASKGASCYDCHPGAKTQCSRSLAHTAPDGNCTTCHGSMATMAASITNNTKVPWVNEPKCVTCHAGVAQVDTGATLFRNSVGHGGVYCSSCHGSPHAMVPSRVDIDNYQSQQYQNYAKAIGSCGACHANSKGEGLGDFMEAHGSGKRPNACYVCHTAITTTDTTKWPHQFQWKATKGSGIVSD
ncbi:cytochrome c3 family protein [Geomesophilobacter sediminis]|uniref:Cytochrome c n=1 Tax=Geomesophilobacter sediminis TaxID=2798584 RepID=A0A8J7LYD2_9BACT|nr:cytochrome c3 family protein [Geomesophilobacter sediminis]MBJ6724597.1 hypothetical protein [Geomesophilobacter sediminis]